jgi:magnesium chelatase subunit ChlI-like protein
MTLRFSRAHKKTDLRVLIHQNLKSREDFTELSFKTKLIMLGMAQLNLSARAYHRTQSVKLAWTIADW